MKLLTILLIIFPINLISAKSHNNCNDQCLTKTYCLSSDGSSNCSKNNLVTAKWFVRQQNRGDEIIGFTLTGQGIKSTEDKTISLTFQTPYSSSSTQYLTTYSCYKSALGSTSGHVKAGSSSSFNEFQSGSSYYSNNALSCTWTFTKRDAEYPFWLVTADLTTYPNYQILLQYGDDKVGTMVANDIRELPIYHLQYLKCCNKVHGNDEFIIIFNQSPKDDQYSVQKLGSKMSKISILLTGSNQIQLMFTCDFVNDYIQGSIINGASSRSISDQLYSMYTSENKCSWSHTLALESSFGRYDTTNGVYDLQVTADNVIVYTEKGVTLKNSSPKLLSSTSILIMIISVLINGWI